jgi:putative flippase GtrA
MTRKQLIKQFAKYMVGGGVYFWSGYAVFVLLYGGLHWSWFPAKVVCDIVGWTLGFFVQRYWAFHHPSLAGRTLHISGRYVLVNTVNFIIDYLIVWGLERLGVTPYIGLFAAAAFFTAWNYLWYKFWVFKPHRAPAKN